MQQNAIKITNCHFVFPHQKFIPGSVEKALKQHLYLNVGYLNLQNNSKLNKIWKLLSDFLLFLENR